MLNVSSATENQKVSVCRLSSENKELILKALSIAVSFATKTKSPVSLTQALHTLEKQLKESDELWLIKSKSL